MSHILGKSIQRLMIVHVLNVSKYNT
ncbi:hypothetical protein Zm00014a_040053 [Zea mays]|uniref:Uncharacterized protein n=1 Tax=Zea mays TaxID=4577 RepID=A0A3L6E508_MAIZE|nr:hypothetical protein Zm00014a_040053 [Zea mays]